MNIDFTPGTHSHQIYVGSEKRYFSIVIPKSIDLATAKIFFFFKGQSTRSNVQPLMRRFDFYLNMNNCIGIFPEQRKFGKHYQWQVQGNDYYADQEFIRSIIALLPVTQPMMFCGVSNGGCFALKLNASGLFSYVTYATIAASAFVGLQINPANIIAIHGKLDKSVPYDGGIRHGLYFLSAEYSIKTFTTSLDPPIVGHIPGMWTYEYNDGIVTSKLYAVENAGHNVLSKYKEIDLYEAIFMFFRDHAQ